MDIENHLVQSYSLYTRSKCRKQHIKCSSKDHEAAPCQCQRATRVLSETMDIICAKWSPQIVHMPLVFTSHNCCNMLLI